MGDPEISFEHEYLVRTDIVVDGRTAGTVTRPMQLEDGTLEPLAFTEPEVIGSLLGQAIIEERDQRVQDVAVASVFTAVSATGLFFGIREAALATSNSNWARAIATVVGLGSIVTTAGGVLGMVSAAQGRGFLGRRSDSGGQIRYFKAEQQRNAQLIQETGQATGSQPSSPSDTL